MNCQSLFSRQNKKNIISLSLAELAKRASAELDKRAVKLKCLNASKKEHMVQILLKTCIKLYLFYQHHSFCQKIFAGI